MTPAGRALLEPRTALRILNELESKGFTDAENERILDALEAAGVMLTERAEAAAPLRAALELFLSASDVLLNSRAVDWPIEAWSATEPIRHAAKEARKSLAANRPAATEERE